MLERKFYRGREQTFVKHFVLEHHLEKLAYKVGWNGRGINYVDGFAGPWRHEKPRRSANAIGGDETCDQDEAALSAMKKKPVQDGHIGTPAHSG